MARWVTRGSTELFEGLRTRLFEAGQPETRPVEHEGEQLFLKARALRGKARVRHAVRYHLLRQSLPRLREFENLNWLRENDFGAPEPLAAGARLTNGLPAFQFLVTRAIEGARTLGEILGEGSRTGHPEAFEQIGREVARLHRSGFVHRDLFPRNLLLRERNGEWELFFLDAWRGGPGRGLRGPKYDLDCFLGSLGEGVRPEERTRFLSAYGAS